MFGTFLPGISMEFSVSIYTKTISSLQKKIRKASKVMKHFLFFSFIIDLSSFLFHQIRFSSAFLQSERKKLRKQRNLLRLVRYESSTHYPSEKIFLHHLPASIISSLKSGQSVLGRNQEEIDRIDLVSRFSSFASFQ